jgi:hypothetical protein
MGGVDASEEPEPDIEDADSSSDNVPTDSDSEDMDILESDGSNAPDNGQATNGAPTNGHALKPDDDAKPGSSTRDTAGADVEGSGDERSTTIDVSDEETDSDEDDGDEEEEEPALKYEKLGGAAPDLLAKDAASALTVSLRLMVRPELCIAAFHN